MSFSVDGLQPPDFERGGTKLPEVLAEIFPFSGDGGTRFALRGGRGSAISGMTSVTIEDHLGNTIDGDVLGCIKGEKVLSDELRAHYVS
jgi:hypothetical protein